MSIWCGNGWEICVLEVGEREEGGGIGGMWSRVAWRTGVSSVILFIVRFLSGVPRPILACLGFRSFTAEKSFDFNTVPRWSSGFVRISRRRSWSSNSLKSLSKLDAELSGGFLSPASSSGGFLSPASLRGVFPFFPSGCS